MASRSHTIFKTLGLHGMNLRPKTTSTINFRKLSAFLSKQDQVNEGLKVLASVVEEKHFNSVLKAYDLDIESQDKRGWTPLMHAARHGNLQLIELLLQRGARISKRCKYSHTPADIAQFWQNKSCFQLLRPAEEDTATEEELQDEHFFGGSFVNRAAYVRTNESLLQDLILNPNTQFILMHNQFPLLTQSEKRRPILFKASYEMLKELSIISPTFSLASTQTAFLGFQSSQESSHRNTTNVSEVGGEAIFCVDISELGEPLLEKVEPNVSIASKPYDMIALSPQDAALCSQARGLLHWHSHNKFCPSCGSQTESTSCGYKRSCRNTDCTTHKGIHNLSYPRVDPSIICLVISAQGDQCLLARGRNAPPGRYSCLAGYVEPGESVAMACRREIMEEAGVELAGVHINTTQPWPSPSVLMIACTSQAKSTEITVDGNELADARWFSRSDVISMITFTHSDRLIIPPPQAIAHYLVKTWLKKTAFL